MIKIILEKPIEFDGKTLSEVVMREPTADDYIRSGEPRMVSGSPEAGYVVVDDNAAIQGYVNALISPSGIPLDKLTLRDGYQIREAVLGFFVDARQDGSKAGRSSSSAASDGSTPQASAPAA